MVDDGPAAGWYEDPEHPGWIRFWDGAAWTDHRSAAPTAAPLQGDDGRGRAEVATGFVIIGAVAAALLVMIFVLILLFAILAGDPAPS